MNKLVFDGNILYHINVCKKYIIIIIIMSRYQHGYSWPSLATPPYCPLLSADSQGYIPYRHRAAVCRFELVALSLLVHGKGSTGEYHLWARPYFSRRRNIENLVMIFVKTFPNETNVGSEWPIRSWWTFFLLKFFFFFYNAFRYSFASASFFFLPLSHFFLFYFHIFFLLYFSFSSLRNQEMRLVFPLSIWMSSLHNYYSIFTPQIRSSSFNLYVNIYSSHLLPNSV